MVVAINMVTHTSIIKPRKAIRGRSASGSISIFIVVCWLVAVIGFEPILERF